ncbi:MAG: hypothetical protein M0Z66_02850 [Thermaerobacter sp.]|nr:hypothetical protein [Thermaerobacter sp.]
MVTIGADPDADVIIHDPLRFGIQSFPTLVFFDATWKHVHTRQGFNAGTVERVLGTLVKEAG